MSAKEVGQRLSQARQARNLDLSEVARATRIRSHYLRALEQGEFGELPSPAQMRGFLRTYAKFLELETQELFDLLQPKTEEEAQKTASATFPVREDPTDSQVPLIFSELGAHLRQRRESLKLTLAEIEEHTHIPEHYVQRLEQGAFDSFPSPSQARGMLGNYAEFLGLDGNEMLGRYAEALQHRLQVKKARQPAKPSPARPKLVFRLPAWLVPLVSRDILFGGAVGILLLVFVVWSIGRIAAARASQGREPTAPPLTGLLLTTPQASGGSPTLLPGTAQSINLLEGQTATPGLLGGATLEVGTLGAIQLRLISVQRTWMRVIVDGQMAFEGRTLANQTYSFTAIEQILLLTGNGAALRGFLNEQDLGFLGVYGEVSNLVFTREGAATPTVSATAPFDPELLTATADAALTPGASETPTPPPSAEPPPTAEPTPTAGVSAGP
ncbi:MAG: RodZ domain-containing protein [Anaerolineales bacterium]